MKPPYTYKQYEYVQLQIYRYLYVPTNGQLKHCWIIA